MSKKTMMSFNCLEYDPVILEKTITYLLKSHWDYECPVVGAMTQTLIFDEEISCSLPGEKAE